MRIVLIIMLLFVSACGKTITHTPKLSKAEVTQEQEKQAQVAAEDTLRKQEVTMQEHLKMQERLVKVAIPMARAGSIICNRLINNAGACVYDFVLSTDEGINASADGKKVKVNISMMRFATSDDELAIVLGHELAHNILGHVDAQKRNVYTGQVLGTVVDALAASQGIKTASLFSKSGAKIGSTKYSVGYEKEADYVGLYITAQAGYDIVTAPDFWRKMSLKNPDAIVVSTTHPTTPERTVMIEKTIEEIRKKQDNKLPLAPEMTSKDRASSTFRKSYIPLPSLSPLTME